MSAQIQKITKSTQYIYIFTENQNITERESEREREIVHYIKEKVV
jgi:hypothetical protein